MGKLKIPEGLENKLSSIYGNRVESSNSNEKNNDEKPKPLPPPPPPKNPIREVTPEPEIKENISEPPVPPVPPPPPPPKENISSPVSQPQISQNIEQSSHSNILPSVIQPEIKQKLLLPELPNPNVLSASNSIKNNTNNKNIIYIELTNNVVITLIVGIIIGVGSIIISKCI